MPAIGARGRAGKSSREQAKSREQRAEQAKNQAEVKQAVNEVQQIADTLKQSKQTANSYTEEVKTVKFKPVVYVQNHIPKETNYTNYGWLGDATTGECVYCAVFFAFFAIIGLIDMFKWIKPTLKQCFKLFCSFCGIKLKGSEKNNNTDQNGKSGCEYNSEMIKSGKKETLISKVMTIIATFIMLFCALAAIKEVLLRLFR